MCNTHNSPEKQDASGKLAFDNLMKWQMALDSMDFVIWERRRQAWFEQNGETLWDSRTPASLGNSHLSSWKSSLSWLPLSVLSPVTSTYFTMASTPSLPQKLFPLRSSSESQPLTPNTTTSDAKPKGHLQVSPFWILLHSFTLLLTAPSRTFLFSFFLSEAAHYDFSRPL